MIWKTNRCLSLPTEFRDILAQKFSQERFNAKIAYLAVIFNSLNSLNLSMQSAGFTVGLIDHAAKVAAYYKKLVLWKTRMVRDEYRMIPELKHYIGGKKIEIKQTVIEP